MAVDGVVVMVRKGRHGLHKLIVAPMAGKVTTHSV
jgi:hypothetical protein